jgi:RNA polymerase sigma-70 factor (ECF subfamily)
VRPPGTALHPGGSGDQRASRRGNRVEYDSATVDDTELIARLRQGDERAFRSLIAAYQPAMIRVAQAFLPSHALAEEATQEAWLGVLRGLDRFEERAAVKTWVFAILVNQARSLAARERRSVPFDHTTDTRAEDPARFSADGSWSQPPVPFTDEVEERLFHAPLLEQLAPALEELPPAQRVVVTLRDIEGLSSNDVCEMLAITPANQRVLLHRARAGLRRSIEALLEREG